MSENLPRGPIVRNCEVGAVRADRIVFLGNHGRTGNIHRKWIHGIGINGDVAS
jgi:hypothetical protein